MALEPAKDLLPCGRDPLTVTDQARAGRVDAHSRDCPYCRAAIGDDDELTVLRELTADAPAAPATLLPRVMAAVWAELRPGLTLILPAEHGPAFATEQTVVTVLEHQLDKLDDLMVHRCRLTMSTAPPEDGTAPEESAEPTLHVEITAAATFRSDLTALAASVRRIITDALTSQFGLTASTIDVEFVDVFEAGAPA